MCIDWPRIKGDSEKLRIARDEAAEAVLKLRDGRPIVAVSGSGKENHPYAKQARELGAAIAKLGFNLTNGGLSGVMSDVSEGFVCSEGAGKAIRIIPKGKKRQAEEVGQHFPKAIAVYTNLPGTDDDRHGGPSSRNHVLIATADAVICMPGGDGSIAEAEMAVKLYEKPTLAYAPCDENKEWHRKIEDLNICVVRQTTEVETWLHEIFLPQN